MGNNMNRNAFESLIANSKAGFDLTSMKPGTTIVIETSNSFYDIKVLNKKRITIFGGTRKDGTTRFPIAVNAVFHGSTWGGSMIRQGWIGQNMHMEFFVPEDDKTYTTSGICKAQIIGPDSEWSYTMDW
jgi:hypothetical protein